MLSQGFTLGYSRCLPPEGVARYLCEAVRGAVSIRLERMLLMRVGYGAGPESRVCLGRFQGVKTPCSLRDGSLTVIDFLKS